MMGPFILPVLLVAIVATIVATWRALAKYDRDHPSGSG